MAALHAKDRAEGHGWAPLPGACTHSGIPKPATCHTLRRAFATEACRGGCDIRTLQHVMGHKHIRTTIYLHVVEQTEILYP